MSVVQWSALYDRLKTIEADLRAVASDVRQLTQRLEALEVKRGHGRPRKEEGHGTQA